MSLANGLPIMHLSKLCFHVGKNEGIERGVVKISVPSCMLEQIRPTISPYGLVRINPLLLLILAFMGVGGAKFG